MKEQRYVQFLIHVVLFCKNQSYTTHVTVKNLSSHLMSVKLMYNILIATQYIPAEAARAEFDVETCRAALTAAPKEPLYT